MATELNNLTLKDGLWGTMKYFANKKCNNIFSRIDFQKNIQPPFQMSKTLEKWNHIKIPYTITKFLYNTMVLYDKKIS